MKLIVPFQPLVQFGGGFIKQKQTAQEHNQIFARHGKRADMKPRVHQRHDVRHKAQHDDAHHNSQRKAGDARFVAISGLDLIGQNCHKHQIVDTEHHFEHQQSGKTDPSGRLCKPAEIHND